MSNEAAAQERPGSPITEPQQPNRASSPDSRPRSPGRGKGDDRKTGRQRSVSRSRSPGQSKAHHKHKRSRDDSRSRSRDSSRPVVRRGPSPSRDDQSRSGGRADARDPGGEVDRQKRGEHGRSASRSRSRGGAQRNEEPRRRRSRSRSRSPREGGAKGRSPAGRAGEASAPPVTAPAAGAGGAAVAAASAPSLPPPPPQPAAAAAAAKPAAGQRRIALSFEDDEDEEPAPVSKPRRPSSKARSGLPPASTAQALPWTLAGALAGRGGAGASPDSGGGGGLLGLDLGRVLGLRRPAPAPAAPQPANGSRWNPATRSFETYGGRLAGVPGLSADYLGALPGEPGGPPLPGVEIADDGGMPAPPGSGAAGEGPCVFGVAAARNCRPYMEDRHALVGVLRPLSSGGQALPDDGTPRVWAAVFDGHNGSRTAEVAAQRLHGMFAQDSVLRAHACTGGPPSAQAAEEAALSGALKRCFRALDDELLATARSDGGRDGATALVVARMGGSLYSAHAGDSRAVLARRGTAHRLTHDHKPNLAQEKARVERAGGRVEFARCWRVVVEPRDGRPGSGLAVSRSLGDLDFKEPRRLVEADPDVTRLGLQRGDAYVVLASDGLWDVVSDEDAVADANRVLGITPGSGSPLSFDSRAAAQAAASQAAESLLQLSVQRGTLDNVTVVVMLLEWGG